MTNVKSSTRRSVSESTPTRRSATDTSNTRSAEPNAPPIGLTNGPCASAQTRCDRAFPTRSLLESGAQVALVTDSPVAGFDPREALVATRLRRRSCSAQAPHDDRRLSALNALHGYTTCVAAAGGEKSALAVGAGPELINFGTCPVESPADDLVDNPVLLTVVDAEIVHRGI